MTEEEDRLTRTYINCRIRFVDLDQQLNAIHAALSGAASVVANSTSPTFKGRKFEPDSTDWIDAIPDKASIPPLLAAWVQARDALIDAYETLPMADHRHVHGLPEGVHTHHRTNRDKGR